MCVHPQASIFNPSFLHRTFTLSTVQGWPASISWQYDMTWGFQWLFLLLKGERIQNMRLEPPMGQSKHSQCLCSLTVCKRGKEWENSLKSLLSGFLDRPLEQLGLCHVWSLDAWPLATFLLKCSPWVLPRASFYTGPVLWMTLSSFPSNKETCLLKT